MVWLKSELWKRAATPLSCFHNCGKTAIFRCDRLGVYTTKRSALWPETHFRRFLAFGCNYFLKDQNSLEKRATTRTRWTCFACFLSHLLYGIFVCDVSLLPVFCFSRHTNPIYNAKSLPFETVLYGRVFRFILHSDGLLNCVLVLRQHYFCGPSLSRWISYNVWINGTCCMPRERVDRPGKSQEATGGKKTFVPPFRWLRDSVIASSIFYPKICENLCPRGLLCVISGLLAGEPWFPHSAVLLSLISLVWRFCLWCFAPACVLFSRQTNPIYNAKSWPYVTVQFFLFGVLVAVLFVFGFCFFCSFVLLVWSGFSLHFA